MPTLWTVLPKDLQGIPSRPLFTMYILNS